MRISRNILLPLFLLLNAVSPAFSGNEENSPFVLQEIRYSVPEAREVYLVWGINNWMLQDSALLPQGSRIKGKLIYTPMQLQNDFFSVKLMVKRNTTIDYVFCITRGPMNAASDVWDTNAPFRDYHTNAIQNNIALIESKIKVIPKEQLSVLYFSRQLLLAAAILLLVFLLVKKYYRKKTLPKPGPVTVVIVSGGVLMVILFLLRISVMYKAWELYYHPLKLMALLWAGFYDFIYVVLLTATFVFLQMAFRNFSRIRTAMAYAFVSLCIVSMVAGILNIRVMQVLGKPFNYRWLYYSDFLFSADAKAAMAVHISPDYILDVIALCFAGAAGAFLLSCVIESFLLKWRMKKVVLTGLVFLNLVYFLFAQKTIEENKIDHDKLVNPVAEFLGSVNPFSSTAELFTMKLPDSLRSFGETKETCANPFALGNSRIKNVILIVLESTPAEYLQAYGSRYRATPEIEKYASSSVVFENVYAHAPGTTKAFTSILSSIYPWLSYTCITEECPYIRIPTISSELKEHGYRTAYFNSGDNSFQRQNEFLSCRKFDTIHDRTTIHCAHNPFEAKAEYWDPSDGINDACTGEALINWVKNDCDSPFFAMMWTYQTHYPYYASGEEEVFDTADPSLNSYLNALHQSDKMIGNILSQLKENGLFESTLVAIIGDHGEAFGRHDQLIHANKIYEENVHIPCIFINPAFHGERNTGIGGQVDIAPTIMGVLNLPVTEKWQGKNLFTRTLADRAYFFCPWSDCLFGYREGNRKYIFNATKDITEIYDLTTDPFETNNLVHSLPGDETVRCHSRLAAWVQYQDKFIKRIFKENEAGGGGN